MKKLLYIILGLVAVVLVAFGFYVYNPSLFFPSDEVEIQQLDAHTWHGHGHLVYNESVYLIEGENSAILIDAATNIKGLRKTVEKIVNKPVSLIISHGHADHIGSIGEWDTIWIHPADVEMLPASFKGEKRYLTDGQVFDLGGRQIEVVFTPGHTLGSTSFIDREAHYGFSSDAFGSTNLLVFTDVHTELATCILMDSVMQQNDIRFLYPGHSSGDNIETPERIHNLTTICRGILDGSIQPNAEGNSNLPHVVDTLGLKVNYKVK